jgi:CRP/FNR family transcriptional regulator, cyclic AMP receptor protein
MSDAEVSGYVAAALVFMTFYMKTMVPLRVIGICSNCAFITYGYLGGLYPVLILHLILLPLNSLRLREMLLLTKQVRQAAYGDPNMDWLKPFTSTRHVKAREVVFHKGDVAGDMFVVLSGRFRLVETSIEIVSRHVVGEFALLTPEHSRTQTLECVEAGILLQISYGQIEQLFFQNPKFGFYFLQLITRRLLQNIARLETELALQCALQPPARETRV